MNEDLKQEIEGDLQDFEDAKNGKINIHDDFSTGELNKTNLLDISIGENKVTDKTYTTEDRLNALLGDEMIAAGQYWFASKLCIGEQHESLSRHFMEHYNEELSHAELIINYMMQKGMKPLMNLKDLFNAALSGYTPMMDNKAKMLAVFFQDREVEAIEGYRDFLRSIQGGDPQLEDMIVSIIADESDHRLDMAKYCDNANKISYRDIENYYTSEKNPKRVMFSEFAKAGLEDKKSKLQGFSVNSRNTLSQLYKKYKPNIMDVSFCEFVYGVNFADEWSSKVDTSWTPEEGLFTKSATEIANTLKKESESKKQAMARLNFYINRAGKNLSKDRKDTLEKAKEKLSAMESW